MPYHSITSHFPEWYRIVALRSLNAENQERCFKDIKNSTRSTNFHHQHIILNSLIRLQVKAKKSSNGSSLSLQERQISREWNKLTPRQSTIITRPMIDENVLLFCAHKKRIGDYLLDGCWHEEDANGNWHFNDGADCLQERLSPSLLPMHLR